ncbi:hypothetical protein ACQ4WX_25250 [Streptomyces lasalocidi]
MTVQDATGLRCSFASARFGAALSPHPVTAVGERETGRSLCQGGGTYYVIVQRLGASMAPVRRPRPTSERPWDLEIAPATEPRTARAGATTAPRTWDSATPGPLGGTPRERSGGTGFASARALGQGVWRTELVPGETRFYKMPLDWGRAAARLRRTGRRRGPGLCRRRPGPLPPQPCA